MAFLGASGAGKSSIAAFLARRGHRFLADDICLIDPAAPRDRRVLPTAPWLKLWDGTLDAMGESKSGLSRIFSDDEKYRYVLQQHDAPSPLTELIVLERAEEHAEASFEQLAPVHAPSMRCWITPTSPGWCAPRAEPTATFCGAERLWTESA